MNPNKEKLLNPKTKVSFGKGSQEKIVLLKQLERKVLWLSTWMIHNANLVKLNKDGLKVGGHQASSASLVSIMSLLYFDILRPADRVAVKPHDISLLHRSSLIS